jgi:hypothetical protein
VPPRGYGDLFEQLWQASQDAIDALKKMYEEKLVGWCFHVQT